jgi:hypothetical protein
MAAPDYVSQVRGVINDLRQNYLQKQQLFQQQEQANANLALNYAQLSAQQDNADRQANIQSAQLEAKKIDDLRQLQKDQFAIDRALASDQLARERLSFDQQRELSDLQKQRSIEERDTLANSLENKFRIAYEKNDPRELSSVMDEIGNSNLQSAQRTALFNNVYKGIETKRQLEQEENNLRTAPDARRISDELNRLDPRQFTPDQYNQKISELEDRFRSLNNTDERVNSAFLKIQMDAVDKGAKYREGEIGAMINSLVDRGEQGRLEPTYQKAYNELKAKPENYTAKALQGLVFQRNKEASIAELKRINEYLGRTAQNLVLQNPGLAVVKQDPITGESYRTFTYEPPDLTPVEGYNGTIDPDTGVITKAALDQAKKWEDEVRSPTFLTGQVPFMRTFQQQQAAVPPAPPSKETAALPFRPTPSRFETVQTAGTAVLPTAPLAPAGTRVSQRTIDEAVAAYNANPNGVYSGRPVRDVIAKLQSMNVPLPGLRGGAIVQGQEQKR